MRRSLRVIARRRTVALILIVGLAAGSAGTGAAHAGAQVGDGPNRPPVVSFVSPAANQVFRSIDSILLSANASDDRGVARVEFRLDGNLVEAAQSPSTNP